MKTQKSPNSENNLETEEQNGGTMLPDFRLYSKDTIMKQHGTGSIKTHRSMKQNRETRNESMSI